MSSFPIHSFIPFNTYPKQLQTTFHNDLITGIFRHAQATKGLERNNEKNVNTLYENFEYAVKHNAMNPFLGIRDSKGDYVWNTYKQVAESRNYVGSGILHLSEQLGFAGPKAYKKGGAAAADNLGLGNTMALGIYAINRPEWVVAEQICNAYGLASVALCTLFSD
jgi:long-chain acyl-CoA synthetase